MMAKQKNQHGYAYFLSAQLTAHFEDRHIIIVDRPSYFIGRNKTSGIQGSVPDKIMFRTLLRMIRKTPSCIIIVNKDILCENPVWKAGPGPTQRGHGIPEHCPSFGRYPAAHDNRAEGQHEAAVFRCPVSVAKKTADFPDILFVESGDDIRKGQIIPANDFQKNTMQICLIALEKMFNLIY
ncbi:MAG: hypothetical protein E7055_13510 [Lentisphaerae bacterium]|nr:hypothetical protein [Lentisphaerota bacterium]